MKILAIETSCDETSAAVLKDSSEVLSSIVSSQIEFHRKYGGIVPELAARKHVEVISPVIKEALENANVSFQEIDTVAVTYGPGLVGSLITGICAAKAIAYAIKKPLIGVNHLEGHIYANYLNSPPHPPSLYKRGGSASPDEGRGVSFPFICLLVSGGHTLLVLVEDHGKYKTLGRTRDDAAGEAYDKVARFLGLGYPGGPIIDKLAKEGNPQAIQFKRPMIEREFGYDFSFSGIKTAVVNIKTRAPGLATCDIVASFQSAVVDVLVEKTIRAAKGFDCQNVALAGGVSANSQLRRELKERGEKEGLNIHIPPFEYCTDNAAMIACAAFYKLKNRDPRLFDFAQSKPATRDLEISPVASLRL